MMSALSCICSMKQAVNSMSINDLLDGDLCKISFISIFSFFWFSNMILSNASILPVSQLQTQQVMTLQNRSHIEYPYAQFLVEIDKKNLAIMVAFNTI